MRSAAMAWIVLPSPMSSASRSASRWQQRPHAVDLVGEQGLRPLDRAGWLEEQVGRELEATPAAARGELHARGTDWAGPPGGGCPRPCGASPVGTACVVQSVQVDAGPSVGGAAVGSRSAASTPAGPGEVRGAAGGLAASAPDAAAADARGGSSCGPGWDGEPIRARGSARASGRGHPGPSWRHATRGARWAGCHAAGVRGP